MTLLDLVNIINSCGASLAMFKNRRDSIRGREDDSRSKPDHNTRIQLSRSIPTPIITYHLGSNSTGHHPPISNTLSSRSAYQPSPAIYGGSYGNISELGDL